MKKLRCMAGGHDGTAISRELAAELGLNLAEVYSKSAAMAAIAMRLADLQGDMFCRLPFCCTVEAEAFGAKIRIADDEAGPRGTGFVYQNFEELRALPALDVRQGRIAQVLAAMKILREAGRPVVLNVEGPFTILSFLIDSTKLFRGMLSRAEIVREISPRLEDGLARYIEAGIAAGASVISYADPAATLEMAGPKIYRDLVGKSSVNLLGRLTGDGAIIHLCPMMSHGLEECGLTTVEEIAVEPAPYGETLRRLALAGQPVLLGHNCLNGGNLNTTRSYIYRVDWADKQ